MSFGDFAERMDELLSGFQDSTNAHGNVSSIEDMQRFVTNFPEYQEQQKLVAKHAAMTHEVSRLVGGKQLMDVSRCEQEVVCGDDGATSAREILVRNL